jgi:serine/threonine-protein kinase HipA
VIYIPQVASESHSLNKARQRGKVLRVAKGIYTDDFDTPLTEMVKEQLLAILGAAYPDWYVSHSTAALHQDVSGVAFLSGSKRTRTSIALPGVEVKRLPAPPHPETVVLRLDTRIARALSAEPSEAEVRVSSPLQTAFEVLNRDARQPERGLDDDVARQLIEELSETDRSRAESFARRNGLEREFRRFDRLSRLSHQTLPRVSDGLEVYFYHYEVGRLESLPHGEFRFAYHPDWDIELSGLPLRTEGPAYESADLPAFFDNLLPEGWSEEKLRAVHKIDREDAFGLLRTTPQYLSNMTLRPAGTRSTTGVLDCLKTRFSDVSDDPAEVISIVETIGEDPETRRLWEELRKRGATRLSGVQAKLPVHLEEREGRLEVDLGTLDKTTTHILKLPSPVYAGLVENEWATMELARRVGLDVASVRRVKFQEGSKLKGPGLLVERFDILRSLEGVEPLPLLEDGASLLGLSRTDKYKTSLEKVTLALRDRGLGAEGLGRFLDHVSFSWLVGNGDLHAKNLSVLHEIQPGRFGSPPSAVGVRYSPLYDLVNTRILVPGDLFALPVNGKENNLRLGDFQKLAARWGLSRNASGERVTDLADRVLAHLDDVLESASLGDDMTESYRRIVLENVAGL